MPVIFGKQMSTVANEGAPFISTQVIAASALLKPIGTTRNSRSARVIMKRVESSSSMMTAVRIWEVVASSSCASLGMRRLCTAPRWARSNQLR